MFTGDVSLFIKRLTVFRCFFFSFFSVFGGISEVAHQHQRARLLL